MIHLPETVELFLPVSREDVEKEADSLIDADLKGDAREAAIDDIVRAARGYESFVETRDAIEQAQLRAAPVVTAEKAKAKAKPKPAGGSDSGGRSRRRR